MHRSRGRGRDGQHRHEGPEHDRHEHGEGRRGRERFFGQGDLKLVILHLLSQKARSGYDIIKSVEEQTGGRYTPSAGVIYPTLTMLQDLEQIAPEQSLGSRNVYTITASGSSYLAAYAATLPRLLAKMQESRESQEVVVPDEVRAAVSEIKEAIRSSLRTSPGAETIGRLINLLNDAVRRIREMETRGEN